MAGPGTTRTVASCPSGAGSPPSELSTSLAQSIEILARIARQADVNGIAAAAVNHDRQILAADGVLDGHLSRLHGNSCAGQFAAIPSNIDIAGVVHPLGEHGAGAANAAEQGRHLHSQLLDPLQVRP
jgi:hypothetical protein